MLKLGLKGLGLMTLGSGRSAGGIIPPVVLPDPLPAITTMAGLLGATAYVPTAGAAWGDSITQSSQPQTMLDSGQPFSAWNALAYSPSPENNTIVHGRWPQEVAKLLGTFVNQGIGGQTSDQIVTRMEAGTPSVVDVVSFGTNDYNSFGAGGSVAFQTQLQANLDRAEAAGYLPAKTIVTQFSVGLDVNSEALLNYARRKGFVYYDWHSGMLKLAHRIASQSASPDVPAYWIAGGNPRAFMSSPTTSGGLDLIHPGPLFSEAHSQEIAAIASALNGGSPYLRNQYMAVDWSVPEGTLIDTLDVIGNASFAFLNNEFSNVGLVKIEGLNVLRGPAAAPSSSWVDLFVEVGNSFGSTVNRISIGRSNGATRFGKTLCPLNTYLVGQGKSGTISIAGKQLINSATRYINIGPWEVQVRTSGDLWFKGPFSSNVIYGGNLGELQHWMLTWNDTQAYTVSGTTYTDRSAIFSGASLDGPMKLFGATTGTAAIVEADVFETSHIYVSNRYHGPSSDLSPIWTGTDTAITGPSSVLAGDTPLYSMSGGPGNFVSKNYGSLGPLPYFPHWDAANAQIH